MISPINDPLLGQKMKITVCICTYNRSEKLARLLENINNDLLIPNNCEVDFLCVDNHSADNTAEKVKQFQAQFAERAKQLSNPKYKLKYRHEDQQGLSHARNCAIDTTDSDWLIFTDDDVILDKNWLLRYYEAIQTKPADFYGGRILLNWLSPKPNWLLDEDMALISGVLGKFDKGKSTLPFDDGSSPCGASFVISRKLVEKNGRFDANFGVCGDRPGRGEETDYFKRAMEKGATGFYCGDVLCHHDALVERLTSAYMLKHGFEKGRAEFLFGNQIPSGIFKQFEIALKAAWQLVKGRRDLYLQGIINLGMLRGIKHSKHSQTVGK